MADTMGAPPETDIGGELARAGERIGGDFRGLAGELYDAVRDSILTVLDEQRIRAADEVGGLAETVRRSAEYAGRHGGTIVSRYAEDAGELIGDFADGLRKRSVGELTTETEAFARREPLLFAAAAIGVGLFAGRLLVSSSTRVASPGATAGRSPRAANGRRRAARRSVKAAVTSGVDVEDHH